MILNQETPLLKYSQMLEQENKNLKAQLNKANQEINRLVSKRVKARNEICEWELTEDGYIDHDGDVQETYPNYCPICGGAVHIVDADEKYLRAYNMHIESEIDWKREQAVGA